MKNFIFIPDFDTKLPISDDVVFPIEIHGGAGDFQDMSLGQKTTHSKEIEIEGSAAAIDFFKQALDFGDGNLTDIYLPISRIKASLFIDNEERMRGVLLLKSATKKGDFTTFKVQIFNEGIDFLSLASEVKISAIPMSDLNHTYTLAEIQSTWGLSKDYYYGLVDKGFDRVNQREMSISSFGMYIKMKALLLRVFAYFNVNYHSNFIDNDAMFNEILLGYGGGDDILTQTANTTVKVKFDKVLTLDINNILLGEPSRLGYLDPITFYSTDNAPTITTNDMGQVNNNIINISYSGTSSYRIHGQITMQFLPIIQPSVYSPLTEIKIQLTIGNNHIQVRAPLTSSSESTRTFSLDVTGEISNVRNGDHAFLTIMTDLSTYGYALAPAAPKVEFSSSLNLELQSVSTRLEEFNPVHVASFLPDITCAELFKGFLRTFSIEYEFIDGTMYLEPFDSFYKSRDTALDKTHLMDREESIDFEFIQNDHPKTINFEMAEIEEYDAINYFDLTGIRYGSKSVENGSFLARSEETITLPWGPVVSFKYSDSSGYGDLTIPRFLEMKDNGTYKPKKGVLRLCFPKVNTQSVKAIDVVHLLGSKTPITTYGTVCEFTDEYSLLWENPAVTFAPIELPNNTLYSIFNKTKMDGFISNEARSFSAFFRISDFDLKTFDRRVLWKIEGSYYRVVSILDSDPSISPVSKVKLIKMISPSKGRSIFSNISTPMVIADKPSFGFINTGAQGSVLIEHGTIYLDGQDLKKLI